MTTTRQFDAEDFALYALQLLPEEETAALAQQLAASPAARREVAAIQGDLAVMAFASEMHMPTAGARTRFLKAIAAEKRIAPVRVAKMDAAAEAPQVASAHVTAVRAASVEDEGEDVVSIGAYQRGGTRAVVVEPEVPRRSFGAKALPWAGWALAAGMALAAGNLYRQREMLKGVVAGDQTQIASAQAQLAGSQTEMEKTVADAAVAREVLNTMNDQTAMRVTLTRKGAVLPPTGRTTYSAKKGVLIFQATNLEPIESFKVYELWLIPANGGDPVPAGTFHPDAKGYANMISMHLPKGVEAKAFGITIENRGGSTSPTLPILMTGA